MPETTILKGTKCSFCKHTYVMPCNGKRYDCANAVWERSKKQIDIGKLTYEQFQEFKESGKKLPDIKATEKLKRVRIEGDQPKKKRVRL